MATDTTKIPNASKTADSAKSEDKSVIADELQQRQNDAQAIVKKNVLWAMGVGAVPIPIIDLLAISGVQVKMLKELSDRYNIPFLEHKVKNLVGALLSGTVSTGLGAALAFSALKVVPLLGTAAGFVAIPIAAGAMTYATGRVFIQHFESGGTFLDFDPKAVREKFRQEFERGKEVATSLKSDVRPS